MMRPKNRREWRAMQAKRDEVAAILASKCMFVDQDGAIFPVEDEGAKRAMSRAFARLIAARGEPQVMRITDDVARSFPNQEGSPFTKDAKAWIGAAFDVDGRAAFAMRWFSFVGDGDATDERRLVENRILKELEVLSAYSGLPVPGAP